MTVTVYIVSRFDETERPYVSTTAPTVERLHALQRDGYQVHRMVTDIPSIGDVVPVCGSSTQESLS